MNDVLDTRIRELMADVVEQSPPPPQFPDGRAASLRRAGRSRIRVGLVWAAAVLAIVATIWTVGENPPIGPDAAEPAALTIEFTVISWIPERLRSEVLAIPGVADATYTITQPEPSGQGAVVTTSASEGVVTTVAPGIVVPSGRPHLTMTVALLPGADPLQVADGLIRVTGLSNITLPEATAAALRDSYFAFALDGAVLLGGDPPVYQPRPGPEPRFDPSTLGSEAPFISAGSLTEALSLARWGVSCPSPDRPVLGTTALVLHIGHLATEEVVFVSDGAPPCLVVESPTGSEAGSFDFSRYPVFGIVSARASSFEAGLVSARVPSETSVAVAYIDGASPIRQRPTAGIVMFRTPPGEFGHVVIESYDVDGVLIERIEERFPVSTPRALGGVTLAAPPFVWTSAGDPEDVALEFASLVLGWTNAVASVSAGADPSGPVWVALSPPGTPVVVDVLTVPIRRSLLRGIIEVSTPAGPSGVTVGRAAEWLEDAAGSVPQRGAAIRIPAFDGAASALVMVRAGEGQQFSATVPQADLAARLPITVGPIDAEPEDIETVLVLYLDASGMVIAVTGGSFG